MILGDNDLSKYHKGEGGLYAQENKKGLTLSRLKNLNCKQELVKPSNIQRLITAFSYQERKSRMSNPSGSNIAL